MDINSIDVFVNKSSCYGCSACYQICNIGAISMKQDEEGFFYPIVDKDRCIDCGLCVKICPSINFNTNTRIPLKSYAAFSSSQSVVKESSSGGVFYELSKNLLNRGGIIYAVRFDDKLNVVHDSFTKIDDIVPFLKSKYVQSSVEKSFCKIKKNLMQERVVLFVGTPCQVAGLKSYLRKEYDNLYTIDIACHGVPSPKVWQKHLECVKGFLKGNAPLLFVNFREKNNSWRKYNVSYKFGDTCDNSELSLFHLNDSYMKGYLLNLYLRPSCHECKYRKFSSGSDITISDFWGVEYLYPEKNNDKGISLVMVHSEKGNALINENSSIYKWEVDYFDAIKYNNGLSQVAVAHKKRSFFFRELQKTKNVDKLIEYILSEGVVKKIIRKIINKY